MAALTRQDTTIVVVGAGMAGLTAADELRKNGFTNVCVLEASDRIGGRMHTIDFGTSKNGGPGLVELGANWIHGGHERNSVFKLASDNGLVDDRILLERMSGYVYRSDGTRIRKSLTNQVWKLFLQWESEYDEPQYSHLVSNLHNYFRYRLQGALLAGTVAPPDVDDVKCIFNCLLNYSRFHEGLALEEVQVGKRDQGYVDIPGGNVKVPQGMTSVIKTLADGLSQNCIKTEHEVCKIIWAKDDESKENSSTAKKVKVTCTNGMTFLCDHVICTVSLGYLKGKHSELFSPSLPKDKSEVIDRIGFGCVNKIFLYYERPFWEHGKGCVKLGWTDTEAELTNVYSDWYKRIFSFDEVLNNPGVLVGWISGSASDVMETLSDDVVMETCTSLLRRFLGNPNVPFPTKVIRSKWGSYQFTKGSYSSCSNKTQTGDQKRLATPILGLNPMDKFKPVLMFAGEATSENGFSTMHGARDSGLREAGRLAKYYGKNVSSRL